MAPVRWRLKNAIDARASPLGQSQWKWRKETAIITQHEQHYTVLICDTRENPSNEQTGSGFQIRKGGSQQLYSGCASQWELHQNTPCRDTDRHSSKKTVTPSFLQLGTLAANVVAALCSVTKVTSKQSCETSFLVNIWQVETDMVIANFTWVQTVQIAWPCDQKISSWEKEEMSSEYNWEQNFFRPCKACKGIQIHKN